MDNILDVFRGDAFSASQLTESINLVPNQFGRINELRIFPEKGVTTTTVTIEFMNNELNLLPFRQRGEAASQGVSGRRSARQYAIPHIPHEDVVKAEEVQNVRAFGSADQLAGVQDVVNQKLVGMANKHFITLEHVRACMLRGLQVDADGTQTLSLFTDFGVSEILVSWDLANANANLIQKATDVKRAVEDELMGDTHTGIVALCSPEWWDLFIVHPMVREAYKYWNEVGNQNPLRNDMRKGFVWQGILFEEYRGYGRYRNADGTYTQRRFIPANDVRFVPMGTAQTFGTYFAPGNFLEAVNTIGKRMYAKQAIEKMDRWVDLYTESNPFAFCNKPRVLVRGRAAAP
jgi:hypothetical protein